MLEINKRWKNGNEQKRDNYNINDVLISNIKPERDHILCGGLSLTETQTTIQMERVI